MKAQDTLVWAQSHLKGWGFGELLGVWEHFDRTE